MHNSVAEGIGSLKGKGSLFDEEEIRASKCEIREGDCDDFPIDFRFLDLLLRAAEDPEVGLGQCALDVRVGPGARM